MSARLVKITPEEVVVQLGNNPYHIPISSIDDIQDAVNPIELERETGVDVVITIKGDTTPVQTEVRNIVPLTEMPFPLDFLNLKKGDLTEDDLKVMKQRNDRWVRENRLISNVAPPEPTLEAPEGGDVENPDGGGTSCNDCTIRRECDHGTFTRNPLFGQIACDDGWVSVACYCH
jgi:hypothetical protein